MNHYHFPLIVAQEQQIVTREITENALKRWVHIYEITLAAQSSHYCVWNDEFTYC